MRRISTALGSLAAIALVGFAGAAIAAWAARTTVEGHTTGMSDSTHAAQSRVASRPYQAAPEPFLRPDEPGGMDDVDVWLMATVAMIPIACVVVLVITYYVSELLLVGLGSGIATAVLMLGILYQFYLRLHFNQAQHASVDTYNDLCSRMHHVFSISDLVHETVDVAISQTAAAARRTIDDYGLAFNLFRSKQGLHWVLGKGYVDLMRLVDRCEESLVMLEPVDLVLGDARIDLDRIEGSTIPNQSDLTKQLNEAIGALGNTRVGEGCSGRANHGARTRSGDKSQDIESARQLVCDVRATVNRFREASTSNIVEARNNLVARMFLTGLATALLAVFVVVAQPDRTTLLTGAILYSVGAIVGLFGRLYADLQGKSFFADFGYSHVQLFQTFLVSGLAAVAGVYLAVVVPSEAPRPGMVSDAGVSISRIYSFTEYPQAIAVAALFGLAPGLLLNRLSQGVDQYKRDLQSSEPSATERG